MTQLHQCSFAATLAGNSLGRRRIESAADRPGGGARGRATEQRLATRVFFVRHGAHDRLDRILCGRMAGVRLSETGQAQARRVAEKLAGLEVAALHVSPLERARQTAAPIGEALRLAPVVSDALNEIEFGEWTGSSFDDLRRHPGWEPWNRARSRARAPGGETMGEVQDRVLAWIAAMRAAHGDAAVVAVCHGDVIKSAVCAALGLSLDHHHRFDVGPASISVVAADEPGLRLLSLNESPAP
jgi:probable phosphoglycerate mutase